MNRDQMIQRLGDTGRVWDLLVIGGGATGLGIGWNASAQGYSVAVLEELDFAHGTSSRSTKLIHGGVRYLRQGQIGMVRSALREREFLLQAAKPWVWPLQLVLPAYQRGSRWYYYAGMKLYDVLAGKRNMNPARLLSANQICQLLPTLRSQGLRGGVSFCDGQFDDAQLALRVAQTVSMSQQAAVMNYAPVLSIDTQAAPRLRVVRFRDSDKGNEFEVRAKVVVNATGVLADKVCRLDRASRAVENQISISPSRGTHLVLPSSFLASQNAIMIPDTDDGRVLFVIPWMGYTLLGTTDVATSSVDREPTAAAHEIDYLLDHASRYLTKAPKRSDILSVFSGLRPLMGKSGGSTSRLSREHELIVSDSGMISVIGGKWTTFRKMGRDVLDLAVQVGGLPKHPYVVPSLAADTLTPEPSPEDRQPLHPQLPICRSDVSRAIHSEMAQKLEDVLSRRTRCLLLNASATLQVAPQVVRVMQDQMGRDASWSECQLAEFTQLAKLYQVTN